MNRLANENSPYLLQHRNNPVDWHPWGPEALEKSRRTGKPIFLSIGYAACHWCHVMEHESFEDDQTAAMMNELFVNIKVDREERPDLDDIYMQSVVAMTGHGGWPMSVFLTPDLEPFYGGTYFPPNRRGGMPAFKEVLLGVHHAWVNDREKVLDQAGRLKGHILQITAAPDGPRTDLLESVSDQAVLTLAKNYDWKKGGWGQAPKFPQPMTIEFLLRRATRGDKMARDMAVHALDAMARGGMYDVVGGGFARYSVDDDWLVPHFEKMLYDNAQLAMAYLHGWLVTGNPSYRRVVEETLDFIAREMTHPAGGFYASLDADSEGEEGKFYIWTPAEIHEALTPELADLLEKAYGITEAGNFEGRNILQQQQDDASLANELGITESQLREKLAEAHGILLALRAGRVRPGTDDKVLTSWNGLMLAAFAEAGRYLNRPDYTNLAMRSANFLLENLFTVDGRLLRSWREGRAAHLAYLEDYGALILGLLALYQTDPNPAWFDRARSLAETVLDRFQDPAGGFYDTGDDHEDLLVRPKNLQDNATPCGGSLAVLALMQLHAFTGHGPYRDIAENTLIALQPALDRYPTAFANWLCALDFGLGPVNEIAVLGDETGALSALLWETYRPRLVAAISPFPPASSSPPLLQDRPLLGGAATAYVCQGFVCLQPVNTVEDLKQQLE